MKSLNCPNCGANVEPSTDEKFLTCPYCDTNFHNEFYEEQTDTEEYEDSDETIYLDDVCIEYLTDAISAGVPCITNCEYGTPLTKGDKLDKAIENFEISDDSDIYFIYDCTIFGGCQRGFALCSDGVYYNDDNGNKGMYTWEEFIDGEISYEDSDLFICESRFFVGPDIEELGNFIIEFSDSVYDYWYEDEE